MKTDPTSLDRLHDLVVPATAPLWPPAPGWYWVLGTVLVVLVISALRSFHRWQKNCYRREALAELTRFEVQIKAGKKSNDVLLGLAELLKRTALTAFSREQVAQLSGQPWFVFLDQAGGTEFSAGSGELFERAVYQPGSFSLSDDELRATVTEIRTWIRNHQVC